MKGLKVDDLVVGCIYRSRLSGLPVQVTYKAEQAARVYEGKSYGPFPVAWIRYYVPGTGTYMDEGGVYDYELEEIAE